MKCENVPAVEDGDVNEGSEGSRGHEAVSDSNSSQFPLDTQGSPQEDRSSPAENNVDRLESGQFFERSLNLGTFRVKSTKC